jgi:hypothetical protein
MTARDVFDGFVFLLTCVIVVGILALMSVKA